MPGRSGRHRQPLAKATTTHRWPARAASPPPGVSARPSHRSPPDTPQTSDQAGNEQTAAAAVPAAAKPRTKPTSSSSGQRAAAVPDRPARRTADRRRCAAAGEPAQVSPSGIVCPSATSDCSATRAPRPTDAAARDDRVGADVGPGADAHRRDVQPAVGDVAGVKVGVVADAGPVADLDQVGHVDARRAEMAAAADAGAEQAQVRRQQRRTGEQVERRRLQQLRTSHQRQKNQPHSG